MAAAQQAAPGVSSTAAYRGDSSRFASIPTEFGLIEGVVRTQGLWVASSVTLRDLVVSADGRQWRRLGLTGMASPTGLAVDPASGAIWAAVGRVDQTPAGDPTFVGAALIDPSSGAVRRQLAAPAGVSVGDIAVGYDGTVFLSDPRGGGIYRAGTRDKVLKVLVKPGALRSPQGIAPSYDGRQLHVAEYGAGLAMVDARKGKVSRPTMLEPADLSGIDGLYRHGNGLVAIQNGSATLRILELDMSADGTRVDKTRVLMQRPKGGGEPTTGQIVLGRLAYVGTAQWDRYGAGGAVQGAGAVQPTELHSVGLSPAR